MQTISAILIYMGLQIVAGVLLSSNIMLAMFLSAACSIAFCFAMRYVTVSDYKPTPVFWKKIAEILLLTVLTILPSLFLQELMEIDASELENVFANIFDYPIISFFAIVVGAPVIEEILFRGIMQRQLKNLFQKNIFQKNLFQKNLFLESRLQSFWLPIFLSAAAFSLFHMQPAQMPHAFILGLIFGILREKYTLTASTLAHILNNGIIFCLSLNFGDDVTLMELFHGHTILLYSSLLISTIGCAAILWRLTKNK